MKVTGTTTLDAPREKVWEAFLNPDVLVSTIPGCDRLEETGENKYLATVTAGVGSIKGAYQGEIHLSDLEEPNSLVLHAQAAGATGTIGVDVHVTIADLGDGTTKIDYDADATVGGMIGGVGQRMLTSVSKRMANEFFSNVNKVLTGARPLISKAPPAPAPDPAAPGQPTESGHPGEPGPAPMAVGAATAGTVGTDRNDLFKGFIAGALSVLIGVLVGALAARRR